MTDITIIGGLGDVFIELTKVSTDYRSGGTTGRGRNKVTIPTTYTASLGAELRLNISDITQYENINGNRYDGLEVKPGATVSTMKNSYYVLQTPEQIDQKINDAKIAAAKLIAEALKPLAEAGKASTRPSITRLLSSSAG